MMLGKSNPMRSVKRFFCHQHEGKQWKEKKSSIRNKISANTEKGTFNSLCCEASLAGHCVAESPFSPPLQLIAASAAKGRNRLRAARVQTFWVEETGPADNAEIFQVPRRPRRWLLLAQAWSKRSTHDSK